MDKIYISTGKELLDSKITKFEVLNGAWIGEIDIRNNKPHLYCRDYNGNLVNSFSISNKTILDLRIRPLERSIKEDCKEYTPQEYAKENPKWVEKIKKLANYDKED